MDEQEFHNAMTEETVEDTNPQENPEASTASEEIEESTDTSPEETEKPAEETTERPTSRASERIRELIAERNKLKAQLSGQQNQFAGVDADGIDPIKYGQSVVQTAEQRVDQVLDWKIELIEARKDPLLQDETAQLAVSGYMNAGATPLEALELYKADRAKIEEEVAKKYKIRTGADAASRSNTQIPAAGKGTPKATYDDSDVAGMRTSEYAANRKEILKSMGMRGID